MKSNQKNDKLAFLDKYSIYKKNPNSEETILMDKSTGELVLMREVIIDGSENFREIVEVLEQQKELRHENILCLIEYHMKTFQAQASTLHKLITFYQYSEYTLHEDMGNRLAERRPFEEAELWSILCSLVSALAFLQRESVGHGSVSLLDIFLTSDGTVKIADPSVASSSPFDMHDGYFYSPEVLKYHSTRLQAHGSLNIFKSDVFILAACMIQAALLQSVGNCINYKNLMINFDALQLKLEQVGKRYSQDLVVILAEMLCEQPEERPDFIMMEERLMYLSEQQHFENLHNGNFIANQIQSLMSTAPDPEDIYSSVEIKANPSGFDIVSSPDEALYLPETSLFPDKKQISIGNQQMILQSSIQSKPSQNPPSSIRTDRKTQKYPTVTVIPHPHMFPQYIEDIPPTSRRASQDIKITINPPTPAVPKVLQERSRPGTNYQPIITHHENILVETRSAKKLPEYSTNQIVVQTENIPFNYPEQQLFSTSQVSKYPSAFTTHYPPQTYIHTHTQAPISSQYTSTRKQSIVSPALLGPTLIETNVPSSRPSSKLIYGLNQLAPVQTQSIQINPLQPLFQNQNVIHVQHNIRPNVGLAPMITSNAVDSRDTHAYLFTDPKLLNMMRADIKKFETYNREFIETEYSKPYFRY